MDKKKKQFVEDVIAALCDNEKVTGSKQLQENRLNKRLVGIKVDVLAKNVYDWRSLFDDEVYHEICNMKYQLNVSKSTDEMMVFYDLHTVEVEKDGHIEVTMYKATAKGEMPFCITIPMATK